MKVGTKVRLRPLFAFYNDIPQKEGIVIDITGTHIVVKIDNLPEHISPYTIRRPWDIDEIIIDTIEK